MPTGTDREAALQVRCREHWRGRNVCCARRRQRVGATRGYRKEVAVQIRDHDLSRE